MADARPEPLDADLGERARSAVLWNVGLTNLLRLGQIALTLVLVRILPPEVYGQYGVLSAAIVFLTVFSVQGFVEHRLHEGGSDRSLDEYFALGLALHGILFVLCNLVAVVLVLSPRFAPLSPYLHVLSLALLLNLPRIVAANELQRELDWRRLRLLHLSGFVVYAAAAVAIAWSGGGLWSLVVANLVMPLPYGIWLFGSKRWPRPAMPTSGFRAVLRFGGLRTASAGLQSARAVLESTMLVTLTTFAAYGLFTRATALGQILCGMLVAQAASALYPVMTRAAASPERFAGAATELLRLSWWMPLPFLVPIAFVPESLVIGLFGDSWTGSVPLLLPAAVLIATGALTGTVGMLTLSGIGPGFALKGDVAGLAAAVLGLAAAWAAGSIAAYAWSVAALNGTIATVLILTLYRHRRMLGAEFLRSFRSGIGSLIAAGAAGFLVARVSEPLDDLVRAVAVATTALAVFVASLRVVDPGGVSAACRRMPGGRRIGRVLFLRAIP